MEQVRIFHFPVPSSRAEESVRKRWWRIVRRQWIMFYRFHRYMGVPPKTFWVINAATGAGTPQESQVIQALHRRFNLRRIDRLIINNIQSLGYGEKSGEEIRDFEFLMESMESRPREAPGKARYTIYVVWPTRYVDWDSFFSNQVDWISAWVSKKFGVENWKMGPTQLRMIPIDELLEELNNP